MFRLAMLPCTTTYTATLAANYANSQSALYQIKLLKNTKNE